MNELIKLFSEVLDVSEEELSLETKREDCEKWDSLVHLRIVMEVESRFGIQIPFEKIPELNSIKDFSNFVA